MKIIVSIYWFRCHVMPSMLPKLNRCGDIMIMLNCFFISKDLSKQLFTYVVFLFIRHFEPVYTILVRYGADTKSDGLSV